MNSELSAKSKLDINSFENKIHRLGRSTTFLAICLFLAVPIILSIVFNIKVDIGITISTVIPIFLLYTISAISERLSYTPVLGPGAVYLSSITGNVSNMKFPAALAGMEIVNAKPGTPKGNIIAIIAVAASSVVTTIIMILGVLFLAPIIQPLLNSNFFKPAFDNLMPALMGALIAPYLIKNIKISIFPILLPVVMLLVVGPSLESKLAFCMPVFIVISIGASYILYKKGRIK